MSVEYALSGFAAPQQAEDAFSSLPAIASLAYDASPRGGSVVDVRHWLEALPRSLRQPDPLFWLCAAVLTLSLLLGGGTRGGFLSDLLLPLFALPLLALGLWRLMETPLTKQAQWALLFCAALALLLLLKLIPLPPWLWTLLPNRSELAAPFEAIAVSAPWLPLSVAPEATWVALLALVAPLTILIAMLLLTYEERRWLSLLILGVGTLSVFVGLLQVAQGPASPWRLYEFTNPTEAVGFFANRNHFAALGYALVLIAAAWAIEAAVSASQANSLRHVLIEKPITELSLYHKHDQSSSRRPYHNQSRRQSCGDLRRRLRSKRHDGSDYSGRSQAPMQSAIWDRRRRHPAARAQLYAVPRRGGRHWRGGCAHHPEQ